ncbi:peptidoglycan DD-metalloendopeptidase family protein [Synechococcus elongatus]|uniref:peptidoglycan DD-metalloendopeptidase family protein n=2 Tax=Synechococcus elongatus TaxID=32046 RepID=UPI0030D4D1F0
MKRGFPQKVSGLSYYTLDSMPDGMNRECAVPKPETVEAPLATAASAAWSSGGRKRTLAMVGLALTVAGTESLLLRQSAAIAATNGALPQLFDNEAESPARTLSTQETHRVQPGETLWSIARSHGLTVAQLLSYNQLAEGSLLRIDQVLRLQPTTAEPVPTATTAPIVQDPVQQHLLALAGDSRMPAPAADERSVEPISSLPPQAAPILPRSAAMNVPVIRPQPLTSTTVAIRPLSPVPEPATGSQDYTVKSGDSLSRIAAQFGLSLQDLLQANRLNNPNLIFVGQRLTIPQAGQSTLAATTLPPLLRQRVTEETSSQIAANLSSGLDAELTIESLSSPPPSNLNRLDITAASSFPSQGLSSLRSLSPVVSPAPALKPQQPEPEKVAVAPLGSETYEPLLASLLKTAVAPELPSLNSDELLPGGSDRFAGYIWPARGILSSGYGWRWGRMHRGIDIAGPVGTPIVAAAAGVVVTAGWNSGGYGNLVEIQHPNGSLTLYAHNNRILVRPGERVQQGQIVAEMGSTGRSTGPHLHFEVHPRGNGAVNPIAYLPAR